MRTSFHHQPEAQHPNFQLSTSWQADYPIFRGKADIDRRAASPSSVANDPPASSGRPIFAVMQQTKVMVKGWPARMFPSASVNGKDAHRLSVCATAMRYDERCVSDVPSIEKRSLAVRIARRCA